MLDLCFRPEIEPLDIIELWLSVMSFIVIEPLTKCHDWLSLLKLINPILWFNLSSSIIWSDLIRYFLGLT